MANCLYHTTRSCNGWLSRKKQLKRDIKVINIDSIDAKSSLDDTLVVLKQVSRDNSITVASKKKKLKDLVFQTIDKSENQFIENENLKPINKALDYIIQNSGTSPTELFNINELITLLRASVKNLNLEQVPYLNYIPIFYSEATKSKVLKNDPQRRIQLFEIFINYILLSNNRYQFVKALDAFMAENPTQLKEVMITSIDALRYASPDTQSLLLLAKYYDFSDPQLTGDLVDLFVKASKFEKSNGHDDHLLENVTQMLTYLDKSTHREILSYIKILTFCSSNNLDKIANALIRKITNLPLSGLSEENLDDIMFEAIKYKVSDTVINDKLMKFAGSQLSRLEYQLGIANNSFTSFLDSHKEELDQIVSQDVFNKLLLICIYTSKSKLFIEEMTEFFREEFGISRDAHSYKILIEDAFSKNDNSSAVALFQESLEIDFIDWANEKDGRYLDVVLKLLANFIKEENDLNEIHQLYLKYKSFGRLLNRECISAYFVKLMNNKLIGDCLALLKKELPKRDEKFLPNDYPDIYSSLLKFTLEFNEDYELNYECYTRLSEHFKLNYQDYFPLLLKFCDYKKPKLSYMIFSNLRKLAKENLQTPPNEAMYLMLFERFGLLLYEEGIFKLHSLMKVDMNITPDINLLNSVLESFTNIEELIKVRDIFDTILALPLDRGMNSRTVSIILKSQTCATIWHLELFWNSLSDYNYLPTRANYKQYLIGHCYLNYFDILIDLIEAWGQQNELVIDDEILKILYNWTPTIEGKQRVSSFAESNYKQIWNHVKLSGELLEGDEETPQFVESGREELLALQ